MFEKERKWAHARISQGATMAELKQDLLQHGWNEAQCAEILEGMVDSSKRRNLKMYLAICLMLILAAGALVYYMTDRETSVERESAAGGQMVETATALEPLLSAELAPQNASFGEASRYDAPYECDHSVRSFFGAYNDVAVELQGRNVRATEKSGISKFYYEILEDRLYLWQSFGHQGEDGQIEKSTGGIKIELAPVRIAFESRFGMPFDPRYIVVGFSLPLPTDDVFCKRVPHVNLTLPEDVFFNDTTKYFVDGVDISYEVLENLSKKLPFTPYIPARGEELYGEMEIDITAGELGNVDPGRETIKFKYQSPVSKQVVYIDESSVSPRYDPPQNCERLDELDWERRGSPAPQQPSPCSLYAITPEGREIYVGTRHQRTAYFAAIDKTLMIINGELSQEELTMLVDSLVSLTSEDLMALMLRKKMVFVAPVFPPKEPEPERPLDTSESKFTVYVPTYSPAIYNASSGFLSDRSTYKNSNEYASFRYIANLNMMYESYYEIEQEFAQESFRPPESCGRLTYKWRDTRYGVDAGPCVQLGMTADGDPVFYAEDKHFRSGMLHYFVRKEDTSIHLTVMNFFDIPANAIISNSTAMEILSSLREASPEERGELRSREWGTLR